MKIFISWSGDYSKKVATVLSEWLELVFQGDKVFMSANDIHAGVRWAEKLHEELETTNFGIICLTPDNLNAPWLLFEAGALSKSMKSHIVPYLMDVKSLDISDPLKHFNYVTSDKDGTFKLVQSINRVRDAILSDGILIKTFEIYWPWLEKKLTQFVTRMYFQRQKEVIKKCLRKFWYY